MAVGVTEIVGVLLGVWLAEGDELGVLEGVCDLVLDEVREELGAPTVAVTVCRRHIVKQTTWLSMPMIAERLHRISRTDNLCCEAQAVFYSPASLRESY